MRTTLLRLFLLLVATLPCEVFAATVPSLIDAGEFLSIRQLASSPAVRGEKYYSVDSVILSRMLGGAGHVQISDFPGSYLDHVILDLKRAHSPINGKTRFVEGTSSGERSIAAPDFVVYRGNVLGEPHSHVMLTVFAGKLLCSILRESGETYVLGPAKNESEASLHVFSKESDLLATGPFTPFNCTADDAEQPARTNRARLTLQTKSSSRTAAGPLAASTLLQADIAVEADSLFYHAAGGTMNLVLGYIASLFAMSSAIYEDEANITWHLTWVKVWSSGDPYKVKGNAYALPDTVRSYWKLHYASVPRDLAHVMTSVSYGGGGFGYYSLCDTNYSYSVSSPQTGHIYPTFAFTYDAYIVAHEIGHNFSLQHSHKCWWDPPLDTCYTKDDSVTTRKDGTKLILGDACDSLPITPLPSPGSIMSYCANANYVLSGKDFSKYKLEMTFTPRGGDSLRKFAMEAPCITPPANPVVILTSPRGSVTYPGDTTISIHWSFANLQNVSLEFSSDGGAKWNAIASNVGASSGILPWKVPNLASQKMLVRIFDATSDTVADTSLLFFSATKTAAIAETPSNPLSFTLRPDPAHDELSIMPSINIRNIHCDILDERGVVIQQVNGNADDCSGLSVSLRSLPAGTYLVHITSPVDTVITFVHYP